MHTAYPPEAYPQARLIDQGPYFSYWRAGGLFIKTPNRTAFHPSSQAVARTIVNEAQALRHLAGIPSVPRFVDYQEAEGSPVLLATEFIDGRTLGHGTLRLGSTTAELIARMYSEVAVGLSLVHATGLVHGDVKPSNLMMGLDGVRLVDFGLARRIDAVGLAERWLTDTLNCTETEGPMGTANFMAPEVCRGEARSVQSDVYSFGCALYWTLTGEGPFAGTSPAAIAYGHIRTSPPAPSSRSAGLDPRFDAIVAHCLAKDPAERYDRMSELTSDLMELTADAAA